MKPTRRFTILATLIAMIAGGTMLLSCSTFGTLPSGDEIVRLETSPQYDTVNQRFANPDPAALRQVEEFKADWGEMLKWLFVKGERTPDDPLPQTVPDLAAFAGGTGGAEVIWFGHSTLLLRMNGKNILIDPVFSGRASPVPFSVQRFQDPMVTLEDLPEIDYIVISHDHYDHLDMETVKHFRRKQAQFLVPLGVGSHLRGWGINADRITELDWWQSVERSGIEFVATPAQHFSGRGLFEKNKTLWASWVIRDADQSIFYSGDSGYNDHFKAIGEAYGPFDAAFLETGQYNNRWRGVHMLPEEAAQAYFDLKANLYVPVHWSMFELSMHTWYQPAMEISAIAHERGVNLLTPRLGESVNIDAPPMTTAWWQPWVDPTRPAEWYAQKVN